MQRPASSRLPAIMGRSRETSLGRSGDGSSLKAAARRNLGRDIQASSAKSSTIFAIMGRAKASTASVPG